MGRPHTLFFLLDLTHEVCIREWEEHMLLLLPSFSPCPAYLAAYGHALRIESAHCILIFYLIHGIGENQSLCFPLS